MFDDKFNYSKFISMKALNVSVTGASGFIGKNLIRKLLTLGCVVTILSRKKIESFEGVNHLNGDLTEKDCPLDEFLAGCDILFHLAGEKNEKNKMANLHIEGTKKLIRAVGFEQIRAAKKIHWVQLSSCGAYGSRENYSWIEKIITEKTKLSPSNEYEITKAISDQLVINGSKKHKFTFSILRPSNVFGPNMSNGSLKLIFGRIPYYLLKARLFFYLGSPGSMVNYVHIDDVVSALIALCFNLKARGEIYNLSNDCTVEATAEKMAEILGVCKPKIRLPIGLIHSPLKLFSSALKHKVHIPTFEILLRRTKISSNKIRLELDFVFSKQMPESIKDLYN